VASVLEQPGETLAEQHLVLRDQDAHGSSAVSTVPAPGSAVDPQAPAQGGDPIGEAVEARTAGRLHAAGTVIGHGHHQVPAAAREHTIRLAPACLTALSAPRTR
jgi:hypothetical protein